MPVVGYTNTNMQSDEQTDCGNGLDPDSAFGTTDQYLIQVAATCDCGPRSKYVTPSPLPRFARSTTLLDLRRSVSWIVYWYILFVFNDMSNS